MALWTFRLSRAIVPRLPEGVIFALAWLIGWIAYALGGQARRNVQFNMRRVLGPDAGTRRIHRTARRVFQYAVLRYCQVMRLPEADLDRLNSRTRLEGWEHAYAALERGQGIIWLSAHLGNPDVVISAVLVTRGIKSIVPVERVSPPELLDMMVRLRASQGITMLPVGNSVHTLLAALRRNESVAIMCDRDIGGRGVPVTFFGHPASLPSGPDYLVRHSGATPLIGLAWVEGRNYGGAIAPLPEWRVTEDEAADARHNMQLVATALERYIRERPEQWVIFAKAWKN